MIVRMSSASPSRHLPFDAVLMAAILALALAIFLIDLSTPRGYTVWLLYMPLCVGAAWLHHTREAIAGSLVATLLILVAWFLVPSDEYGLPTLVSRLLEIVTVWTSVALVLIRQRAALATREAFSVARKASHRLSGIIINNTEDAIVCVDDAHRITLFNHGAERMFGFTPVEAVGQDLSILLPKHVVGHHRKLVQDFAMAPYQSRRMGERGTIMGRRRDGSEFPTEITISKLQTPEGVIFTAILRDISQRVAAEQESNEQRQRLRLAMLAGRMGTFDFDESHGLVRVDETTLRLLHLPLTETDLPYSTFFDRMHPDDRDSVFAAVEQARRKGEEFRIEYRLLLEDGSVRWIAGRGFGQVGENGQPRRVMGITYDITDRVTAERSIRESEALYRSTLKALPALVAVIDSRGFLLSMNDSWIAFSQVHLMGESEGAMDGSQLLGKDYFGLINRIFKSAAEAETPINGIREVLSGARHSFSCEVAVEVAGEAQWFLMTAVPLDYNERGGAVISHLDITKRKMAEALVFDTNKALEARVAERTAALREEIVRREAAQAALLRSQKLQAVGELAGGIAHDFNNLLTVITGYLELLSFRTLDSRSQELVLRADDAAKMGARLSSRLLLIGRRQRLEPVSLDLREIVRSMVEVLRPTLGDQIEIRTNLVAGLWPVLADLSELENAILNLAINARDAMPNGGVIDVQTCNKTVDVSDADDDNGLMSGDYVMLSIRDNGRGISQDVLARVFEPYFSTKESGRGTGLGLSTIYYFAKQSGGHVTIDSEVGKGTCVRLFLPRSIVPTAPADRRQAVGSTKVAGECVLVVEDNPDVRDVTVKRLDILGYSVLIADNGKAAIELLEHSPQVQLVFSDVVMPGGVSGFDLARWVKSHRPDVKILLTSGFTGAAGADENSSGGPEFPLLKKPYALPELARAVREALS